VGFLGKAGLTVGTKQAFDQLAQLSIVAASLVQVGRTLLGRQRQRGVNNFLFSI
jgi:hypothetical protein